MSEARCCLITGPTHGIGRVTVERLSEAGFDLVLACRNVELGRAVAKSVVGRADVFHCDLAEWDSVAQLCSDVLRRYSRLDLLINNAGFIDLAGMRVGDYPAMMAVNHLGPYLLTTKLLDLVTSTPGSRIINVASHAHRSAKIEIDDPLCKESTATGMAAYGQSKLANVLFTLALSRRLAGSTTTCNALHPGVVGTNIMANAGRWMKFAAPLAKLFMLSEEKGAKTTLYLSTSNAAAGLNGQYLNEKQQVIMPSVLSQDPRLQESLWKHSEAAVSRFT